MLAVVCNDYFLPSVECICEDLKISPDVAAATFMAVSGAIPEFFTNIMSTFVTESQMGLGAVIGTLFFNTLGVAACAGMASIKPVQLLWYPLARDCVIFSINVTTLTIMIWDGEIQWYEALILSVMYIVYWIVLFQNERIRKFVHHYIEGKWHCCRLTSYGNKIRIYCPARVCPEIFIESRNNCRPGSGEGETRAREKRTRSARIPEILLLRRFVADEA